MKKVINLLIALPIGLVLLSLALANRQPVRLALNPFQPDVAPALMLPFYVYLLGGLIAGVALGGLATWLNQGRWRHSANLRTREARRWQAEAERLTRERDEMVTKAKGEPGKHLAIAGRR